MKRICVVGSGATWLALSSYFVKNGLNTVLTDVKKNRDILCELKEKKSFTVVNFGKYDIIDTQIIELDIKNAVEKSDLIIVAQVAQLHSQFARECQEVITKKHTILITPGNMGSVVVTNILKESMEILPIIGEVESNLQVCKRNSIDEVELILPPKERYISAYPSKNTDILIKRFEGILKLKKAKNILETTLNHPNIDSHLPGCIFNLNKIIEGKEYSFYKECINDYSMKFIEKMYEEKVSIMKSLSLESRTTLGLLYKFRDGCNEEFIKPFYKVNGPTDTKHRFISEDAYVGGALVVSLGKKLGNNTEITYSLVKFASILNDYDYLKYGITLDNLLLDDVCSEYLNKYC